MDPFQISSEVFLLTQNVSKIFQDRSNYAWSVYLRDLPTLLILLEETNDSIKSQALPASNSIGEALDFCVHNFKVMCECLQEHRWSSSSGLKSILKAPFSRDKAELEHTVDSFRKSVNMLRQISMDARTQESLAGLTDMVRNLTLKYQSEHTTDEGSSFSDPALISAYTGLTGTQTISHGQLVHAPIEQPTSVGDASPFEQVQQLRASQGRPFALTVELFVKDSTTGRYDYIPARTLLDTGADVNIASSVSEKTHTGHGNEKITSKEEIDLDWFDIRSTKTHSATFCVFDGPARYDLLLGQEWLRDNKYNLAPISGSDGSPEPRESSVLTLFTKRRSKEIRKKEKQEKSEANLKAHELIKKQDEEEQQALGSSSSLVMSPPNRPASLTSTSQNKSGTRHSPSRSPTRLRPSMGSRELVATVAESSANPTSFPRTTVSPSQSLQQMATLPGLARLSLGGLNSAAQAQREAEARPIQEVTQVASSEARSNSPKPRRSTDDKTEPTEPAVLLVNGYATPRPSESNSHELRHDVLDWASSDHSLAPSRTNEGVISNGNPPAPQSYSSQLSTEAQLHSAPRPPSEILPPAVVKTASENGEQKIMENA